MGIDIQAWRASIGPWHLRGPKWSRKRSTRNGPLSREGVQWRQCILQEFVIVCAVLTRLYIVTKLHLLSGEYFMLLSIDGQCLIR